MSMITIRDRRAYGILASLLTALLFVVACDSPEEAPPAEAQEQPAAPAGDGRMASIDADGNIAPFGFASRKPVPVPELQAAAATAPADGASAATSVVFGANCVACHGPDAKGVEGLGVNLVDSKLVADSSAAELVEFLKAGRAPDAPDNVTGVPMPSFAWMTEADLNEVSNYLKTL
jgi:mono/diheme cytochrome c family protein